MCVCYVFVFVFEFLFHSTLGISFFKQTLIQILTELRIANSVETIQDDTRRYETIRYDTIRYESEATTTTATALRLRDCDCDGGTTICSLRCFNAE